ncbi:MAG: hypothetical protein A3I11_01930 [Elusimicrobia bacterium RIFCSPLOWO2_02_FULL_39_32]|nr:MAG: hypothetical protein A3B80_06815 [Elusimicrobia bacterium RIFCSPHIGHO2_02_FULL_39_36]OGR92139.1 MAG: hypothetical protein A3I11_01930 [Elusimicrobia bacterium RIFCSPLOWO2_02_FULL_39_32]OGR99993.1 MAG: hypothetical protein A3G85_03505 [Elusimicrobia bacterium RIFCSPLOWO2_12_FULL_39_28]
MIFFSFLKHFKPPRSLGFTPFGAAVVLLTVGVGLAAMNTGNNLVYMVFGMMLGLITASGILSEINLRHLEIDWIFPMEVYAKKTFTIRMLVRNQKEKIPSFGINTALEISLNQKKNEWVETNFLMVSAKSQKNSDIQILPEKRGELEIKALKIETQFPFSFFKKYFIRPIDKKLIVYPQLIQIPHLSLKMPYAESQTADHQKGFGDSFWGIKEFSEGDNPKNILWKSSAKFSKLMVRETEKEREKEIFVTLLPEEEWLQLKIEELEAAISFTASFLDNIFKQGIAVGLISNDFIQKPSTDRKNLIQIFTFLALFSPKKGGSRQRAFKENWGEPPLEILSLWKKQ